MVAVSFGASAQQAVTGSVTKVDEALGRLTIQPTQSGTVGASAGGAGAGAFEFIKPE
jgi:hypothetical protein